MSTTLDRPAEPAPDVPGAASAPDRWVVAAAWALGTLAVLPALVAAISGIGRDWYPAGDWAMLELATRDVGTADTPLTGPYSRFSWNHPGPLLFWFYAPGYRLTGGASWSLLVSAGLLNAGCVAAMVALAWRRGRLPLVAITSVVLSIVSLNLGAEFLRDPWNAWITTLPLGLLVFLVWSAVEGERNALVAAVLVGSFLVQSHVGFGLIVAVLWAVAVAGALRRDLGPRPFAWAGGVLVLCWLPVLIDQVAGRGNLADILSHFSGDEASAGLGRAVEVVARQLGGLAPWMGGDEPADPVGGALQPLPVGALAIPVAAFAWAAILAAWKRRYDAVRFQAVVGVGAVIGLASVARISGRIFDYLVRWWWLLAALWWISTLWSLWRASVPDDDHGLDTASDLRPPVEEGPRAPSDAPEEDPDPGSARPPARSPSGADRLSRGAQPTLAVVALLLAGWFTVTAVSEAADYGTPAGDLHVALEQITPPSIASVSAQGEVLLRSQGGRSGWFGDALGLQLERAGIDVVVADEGVNEFKWRPHRLLEERQPVVVLWVVAGPVTREFDRRGFDEVVRWDALDPATRAERAAQEDQLFDQLIDADRPDLVEDYLEGRGIRDAWALEGIDGALAEQLDRSRGDAEQVVVYLERTG